MYLVLFCNDCTTCPEFSAPRDYGGGTFTCTISEGVAKINCPSIPTYLDMPLETDEYFKATLSLPGGLENTQVGPDPAFVTITDRTGKNAVMVDYTVMSVERNQLLLLYNHVHMYVCYKAVIVVYVMENAPFMFNYLTMLIFLWI